MRRSGPWLLPERFEVNPDYVWSGIQDWDCFVTPPAPDSLMELGEMRAGVQAVLQGLRDREVKVLDLRFREEMTLLEVAGILGVSKERVRQIEAKTLNKLRRPKRAKHLKHLWFPDRCGAVRASGYCSKDMTVIHSPKRRGEVRPADFVPVKVENLGDVRQHVAERKNTMEARMSTVRFNDCKCIHATEKAILVVLPDMDDEPIWVPNWAVHDDSEVWQKDDEGDLVLEERFARKEGL